MIKSSDEIQDVLAQCYNSTLLSAKILFPDRFTLPFSGLHKLIEALIDDDSVQKVAIAAPRGFGKTSLVNLALPGRKILFRDKKFIVPVSNTATQATLQSENLKRELLSNDVIGKLFGQVKGQDWTKDMWVTSFGTAVMPRGAGQQIRGILYNNDRPDLIICDDLEDAEAVRSDEQRAKLKEWFFADVLGSVDKSKNAWKIVVIGTILHEDSLLENLLNDPEWKSIRLSICDDEYRSSWPEQISDEGVRKLRQQYKEQGLLDTFAREYRNLPVSKEDATFRQEYFRYYDEKDLPRSADLETFIIVDPAKTVKIHSADTAVVGVSVDLQKHAIYVRDIVAKKLHPDEIYRTAFDMADRLGTKVIGIEVTSLNEFITYPIRNEMLAKRKFYEIVELSPRAKKEDRVAALAPFYRMGYVYHKRGVTEILEDQLTLFPRSKRWDVMDAVAYCIEMLEQGERYFFPSAKAEKAGETLDALKEALPEDPMYPTDDEYDELEYDAPIENFRIM